MHGEVYYVELPHARLLAGVSTYRIVRPNGSEAPRGVVPDVPVEPGDALDAAAHVLRLRPGLPILPRCAGVPCSVLRSTQARPSAAEGSFVYALALRPSPPCWSRTTTDSRTATPGTRCGDCLPSKGENRGWDGVPMGSPS